MVVYTDAWKRRGTDIYIYEKCGCEWEDQREESNKKDKGGTRKKTRENTYCTSANGYVCVSLHVEMKIFLDKLPVIQSLVHISLILLLSSDFDRGYRRKER